MNPPYRARDRPKSPRELFPVGTLYENQYIMERKFGAVGGAFTGADDIFYVMIAQGLAIPALIVLGANIWTTKPGLYLPRP